jgi:hypothetical protein
VLRWPLADALEAYVAHWRATAAASYRDACARYDMASLMFVLGGLKQKPTAPPLPAILQGD